MAVASEVLKNLDSLTDEQLESLLSSLLAEKSGREKKQEQKNKGIIFNHGVPVVCPDCGSVSIKKEGKRDGVQKYKCLEENCKRHFNSNSNTMFHRSRLSKHQWKTLLLGMVQNLTLSQIADSIDMSEKTVWQNKIKVMVMLYNMFHDQDVFVDIAECDEYSVHMSFKGKKDPSFFVFTLGRLPRHHRTRAEKIEYLQKAGLWAGLQTNPVFLEQLLSGDTYLNGTNRDSVCILTGRDRSGNMFAKPVCLGNIESKHVIEHFKDRFEPDAIMVTDSNSSYNWFAEESNIHHEKILSEKHTNGPYSLSRVNAMHSNLAKHWPDAKENLPATKYLDINLMFFWWLEKNKDLTTQQKVDELFGYLQNTPPIELTYEMLKSKNIGLDTKGLIPPFV